MLFLLAASIVTLGLAAVLPDNKVITNIANEHGKIQQDFFNFFESIGENDPKRKETYRSILEGETRREQQAFDSMKDEWRSARFQSGKQRQSHTALKREAEKTSAKMPDAIFFGFTCGKPINEASHREVQENLRDLFDSIQKSDAKNVDNVRNILARETAREKQAFDTAKDELRLARRKSVHKQKDVEHQAAFKREAINDDKKPGDTTSTTSSNSLQRTTDNVEDLREELKADEIPRSHAHNAGLNKAAARLLPVISSLRKDLTTLDGLVKYLIEVVSLCVLRNKIDHLEARYGVGDLEVDVLAKLLKQDSLNLKKLVGDMRQYINTRRESEPNTMEMQQLVTKVKLQVEEDLKKLSQTPVDPKMSDSVSVKAGKHALRCLLIFHQYPMDKQVKEMKKVVDLKFDGSIDDACREQGFLVVLLSTLGIHVLPPSFGIRNIAAADMKRGLHHFGICGEKSMAIVDLLHCGEVDESYMKSLSTISSS